MRKLLLATVSLSFAAALPAAAASITSWNQDNVLVGATPPDHVTGESVVYDTVLPGATTNGKIVFTPPEAVSPGIEVSNVGYSASGGGVALDGCIKTSSAAACDDDFQSGKRIKQVMTGTGPMDLVFDIDSADLDTLTYQVFGRLINATNQSLRGFQLTLGYGIGDSFVEADVTGGLSFSTAFTAQPSGSGSSNTQFPFGLFGDASTNKNFVLDGFFDNERTGLNVEQTATTISSTNYYGNYGDQFGAWMTQDETTLPAGLFWDFDADENTDDLLMAWEISDGVWELRRDALAAEYCDPAHPDACTWGETRDTYFEGTYAEVVALLGLQGVDASFLGEGAIEDLANINVNYAIALGDMTGQDSFTLRTVVTAVPLPAGAPLMLAAIGAIGMLRKRKTA